jgi:hypothetical protein
LAAGVTDQAAAIAASVNILKHFQLWSIAAASRQLACNALKARNGIAAAAQPLLYGSGSDLAAPRIAHLQQVVSA